MPVDFANKNVSIQITLPAQQGVPDSQPRAITIQVPASALHGMYNIIYLFNLFNLIH